MIFNIFSSSLIRLTISDQCFIQNIQIMSWLCTEVPKILKGETQTFVGNEFRMVDPKTKQIYCEMVLGENTLELKKYQNWRRIKIQTVNTKGIANALKQSKQHFIDPTFPHDNSVLSSEYFQGQVEWIRVRNLIENAVYSKQQTLKTLQKLKLNRKEFEQALILISRSSPTLFKQLVSKNLNPEGLYEYKIFKDGKIRNIAIDDYLPSQKDIPFFVGPVRGNQVYPMLIEKALAKACGTYDKIPESTEQILQMIFCGPVKKHNIIDLREEQKLDKVLKQCMHRHFLTVILSKREPKLRNYGLNEGQVYNIVNHHNINIKGEKETSLVYELVSQSKVSGWNGKFSLNDPIWQKVQSSEKFQIYRHLKTNQSFLISESDIGRHFEQLLVFQSMDINNKDWCDHESTNNFPSFTSFTVTEKDRVFIRVTAGSKIRQTLILVREIQAKEYEFIGSFFEDGTYKSEISAQLQPGKYIVAVYHNWFLDNSGKYNVFLASEGQITLNKGGIADIKFLSRMLKSFDEKIYKQQQKTQKNYKMRLQIQKLGLAWLQLYPKAGKGKSLKLQINHQWLQKEGWEVLEPYSNVPTIDFNGDSKEQPFVILKKLDVDSSKKYYFPTSAFIIK